MVKNPPSNAGDAGSIPGQGTKIPHAAGQQGQHTTTTEPAHSGAHAPQLERSLYTATGEDCMPQQKDPVCHNEDPACRN